VTDEVAEILLPGPAQALGALLGVPVPDLERGEPLPLLWHWVYLLDRPAQAELRPDGSAQPGAAAAAGASRPGERRMWAGGRVLARGPLRCGEPAVRRTSVLSVREKQGRSGPLTFVVVGQQIRQDGTVVIDEQRDIVYRGPSQPDRGTVPDGAQPGWTPAAGPGEWVIETSPTLLFRFSALTYNAHRIHYDRDYARDVEGYPGLLVHGPLQALAMAEAARARGRRGAFFEYRLLAPLFDHQGMMVSADPGPEATATAVRDGSGRPTASGTLRAAPPAADGPVDGRPVTTGQ
jgi:3-methylfumaryl-CoA hydratase